jgi:hypothetical protein
MTRPTDDELDAALSAAIDAIREIEREDAIDCLQRITNFAQYIKYRDNAKHLWPTASFHSTPLPDPAPKWYAQAAFDELRRKYPAFDMLMLHNPNGETITIHADDDNLDDIEEDEDDEDDEDEEEDE